MVVSLNFVREDVLYNKRFGFFYVVTKLYLLYSIEKWRKKTRSMIIYFFEVSTINR